jgi:NADH-dependent peroxiredoxin subunit F
MALEQNIKNQLSAYMAKIENPIQIKYFENQSLKSNEMVELLKEVHQMTDKIDLQLGNDPAHRSPSFQVNQPDH